MALKLPPRFQRQILLVSVDFWRGPPCLTAAVLTDTPVASLDVKLSGWESFKGITSFAEFIIREEVKIKTF